MPTTTLRQLPPPTTEQQAIITAGKESRLSLMITAYAGCAKTTTLEMLAQALPQEPTLALAFNVKNKKDLEERFPSYFEVKTMNGLGHTAWARATGKRLKLDPQKQGSVVSQILKAQRTPASTEVWVQLKNMVTSAMQAGLVPKEFPQKSLVLDNDETWAGICEDAGAEFDRNLVDFARAALIESVKQSYQGTISFDDQIYMSTMYGGLFPRFPRVIVDEAQDLSPLNHIMLRKSASDRLIVVGDSKQAIYAFRGADSASMAKIKELRPEWIELPLALTFRCPQKIVERQQEHAKGFTAHTSNKVGHVGPVVPVDSKDLRWTKKDLFSYAPHPAMSIAILCRNNAPLMSMAFKLIRQGVGCTMLGRELGKGLVALSKKLYPIDDTPIATCMAATVEWREREYSLALANNQSNKADTIIDKAECLIAVMESSGCKDAGGLRAAITQIFEREGERVTLATGHRSKGLEWDVVLHLDPWRIPAKFAKSPSAIEQELNLKYVIETRSKNVLLFGDLESFATI